MLDEWVKSVLRVIACDIISVLDMSAVVELVELLTQLRKFVRAQIRNIRLGGRKYK